MRLRLFRIALPMTLSSSFAQTKSGSKEGSSGSSTGQQGGGNQNTTGSSPKQSDSKKCHQTARRVPEGNPRPNRRSNNHINLFDLGSELSCPIPLPPRSPSSSAMNRLRRQQVFLVPNSPSKRLPRITARSGRMPSSRFRPRWYAPLKSGSALVSRK